MASLFWTKLNPKIVCDFTRKQFYGQYCYKLVLEAYGSREINEKGDLEDLVKKRHRASHHYYNYGGSWYKKQKDDLLKIDVNQLEVLRSIKNGYGNTIKIRVEEPWVQIYARDEQTLQDIVGRFDKQSQTRLISISMPSSPEQQALLEQGHLLTTSASKNEYKYKVFLRDGTYGSEASNQIAAYLKEMGDTVKVTASVMKTLSGKLNFLWGGYFYTNDLGVTTMISLIAPGIVGKIHELVKIEQ